MAMSAEAPGALLAGGVAFALPPGARRVPARALRPAPLAASGLLGLTLLDGGAVPVFAAAPDLPGGGAWVALPPAGGAVGAGTVAVVAGEALLDEAPAGAQPLPPLPAVAPRPAPPPRAVPVPGGAGWTAPVRRGGGADGSGRAHGLSSLAVELGALRLALPFAVVERIVPLPSLRPAPGAPDGALGYAIGGGGPALVIDPAWAAAGASPDARPHPAAKAAEATLLVLLRQGGRRLGLPCARVGPARPGDASLAARLESPAAAALLAAAPVMESAPPPPGVPTRGVLVCVAAGQSFALPVEEVVAVIAPQRPAPAPPGSVAALRGVCAHRGDVLPVLDAGERLGLGRAVLDGPGAAAVPMLRLAGPRPVALAVGAVTGLRRLPEPCIAPVADSDGLVAAVAELGDAPLPICSAAALSATALLTAPARPAAGGAA